MHSRIDSNTFRSCKYKETQCVEYDQKDGVVSDLKEIIYELVVKKGRPRTQKKKNAPKPGLRDWKDIRGESRLRME